MENIVFLVEDTLFKVPRTPFERSGIFATVFTLPAGENKVVEGCDDEHPFKLEGVGKVDFVRFLRHLYPQCDKRPSSLHVDELTSVLKLSTMWDFTEIRESAIGHLSFRISVVAQVVLGGKYKVPQWLFAGYEGLAKRKEAISMSEAAQLGFSTAFRIGLIRERVMNRYLVQGGFNRTSCDCTQEVMTEFMVELKEAASHDMVPKAKAPIDFFALSFGRPGPLSQRS